MPTAAAWACAPTPAAAASGSSCRSLPQREHRARRAGGQRAGDAAEEQLGEADAPARAEDDQVGGVLRRDAHDGGGGIALLDGLMDGDALVIDRRQQRL